MVSKFSHGFSAKSKFLTQKSILSSSITRKCGRKNQEVKLLTKIRALLSCLLKGKCRLVHHSSTRHSAMKLFYVLFFFSFEKLNGDFVKSLTELMFSYLFLLVSTSQIFVPIGTLIVPMKSIYKKLQ